MKRTVSILLCLLLGISYLPCIGEESYAIETDDDWKYSLTMPEEAYDCVEEVMLYRYNDPIETMSTAETMEGYEPAGKQVISSEAGSWTLAEPEVGEKIIDGDTISEQTVEKKSVCYSFAYTDTVNDWFWLNPDARHYVKYMDEDVVGNHELTGTLPTDEDYAVCVNFLQIFSENDIAGALARQLFRRGSFAPRVAVESENMGTMLRLCLLGRGAYFCPENLARALLSEEDWEKLHVMHFEEGVYELSFGWQTGAHRWQMIEKWMEMARRFPKNEAGGCS